MCLDSSVGDVQRHLQPALAIVFAIQALQECVQGWEVLLAAFKVLMIVALGPEGRRRVLGCLVQRFAMFKRHNFIIVTLDMPHNDLSTL